MNYYLGTRARINDGTFTLPAETAACVSSRSEAAASWSLVSSASGSSAADETAMNVLLIEKVKGVYSYITFPQLFTTGLQ